MLVNRGLATLFVLMVVGALWTTGQASVAIYHYYKLARYLPARNLSWQVVSRDAEHHLYRGTYSFTVANKEFTGATTLPTPAYRNIWAAEKGIKEMENEPWYIWYDPSDPTTSTLYRSFPLKEAVYSAIMWALVCYFAFLISYVSRR